MLNSKTLKRLVFVTFLCAVPVIIITLKGGVSSIKNKNVQLFPHLMHKPDQIAKITIQDHTQVLTLQKTDDAWHLVERNNYPALTEKVDEFIFSLADLRIVEPKTTNPDLFKQLDVNDITEADSQGLLIIISDLYNDTLAQLIVGKREGVTLGEEYQEHIFVRKPNEDQTWLVQGIIPVTNDFRDWVDQPLLGNYQSDQIKSVEIDKPHAAKILISKTKPDQEDFTLANVQAKPGMVLDLDAVNTVPFEIAELEYIGVQPATTKADWHNSITATLESFSGAKVILNILKAGNKVLAKVHLIAPKDATPEQQQSVAKFNSATEPWLYELSPEIYQELALNPDDFLKPIDTE